MASKFSDFLQAQKLDSRRVAAASREIEKLRPEDRAIRLKKRQTKGTDAAPIAGSEAAAPKKPRSGRPVTPQLLARALEGKLLSGPGKTRLLRAVNRVLEQKKKAPIDLRVLF
jgi:hypothetical protein